jgi:hypothetical protein
MNTYSSKTARMVCLSLCLLLVGSASASAQGTNGSYFLFPRFVSCNETNSGFAIVNPNGWEASVTLFLVLADNSDFAQATIKVPPRGQVAKTAAQVFGSACADAYLVVSSETSGLIATYQTFSSNMSYMDGTDAPTSGMELLFPIVPGSYEGLTEIDLMNDNERPTSVELSLWSLSGTLLGKARVQVPALSAYRNLVTDIFPAGTLFSSASHITTSSQPINLFSLGQPVSGTSLFAGFSSAVSSSGSVDLAAANAFTPDQLSNSGVIPYFRAGGAYSSFLSVANVENASVDATFTAISNDGANLGTRKVTLSAHGGYRGVLQSVFPSLGNGERNGWILVSATGRVAANLIHGRSDASSLSTVPMQKGPALSFIFPQIAQGGGYTSELSLVNASATATTADVYVVAPDGTTVTANQVSIGPNSKVTRTLSQILFDLGTQSGGYVFVRGKGPLFSTYTIASDDGAVAASFAPRYPSASFSPAAQTRFAVTGTVMFNDTPAAGVRVVLSGPSGTITTVNADGTYILKDLAAGRYSLAVDAPGFQFAPAQVTFELNTFSRRQDFRGSTSENGIVLQPTAVAAGSQDTTATVYGLNFNSTAQAYADTIRLKTTLLEANRLQVVIPAYMLVTATQFEVYVVTNDLTPERRVSQSQTFFAYVSRPALDSIDGADTILEGSPGTTLTLNGKGFLRDAVVKVNGVSDGIRVTFLDSTQLVAFLPSKYFQKGGVFPVTVENPVPSNVESNVQLLTVYYPAPGIEMVLPASLPVRLEPGAGPVTIDVLGYGFRRGAIVTFNGRPLVTFYCESDLYCLSTHMFAVIPASELRLSGYADIRVENPSPSLGTSQNVNLTVKSLEPMVTGVAVGNGTLMDIPGTFEIPIIINGANFNNQTYFYVYRPGADLGSNHKPDEVLSSNQIIWTWATVDFSFLGDWIVEVVNPLPGGGSVKYPITLTQGAFSGNPFLIATTPQVISAGMPGITMVITGTNLKEGSEVLFGSRFLPTTFLSNKQLVVEIPAELVAVPGRIPISVINPDTGGASNRLFLDIR